MKKLDVRTDKITVGVAAHSDPLKQNKGITLIALIITIIVMLILVGVTINVALNGGVFETAETAANSTTVEAEKEALSMAAIAAWEVETGVDFSKMELPDGFSGSNGTYTSSKSGKKYTVDQATAKVTEGGTEEVDEDLAYMKAELEGKMFMDVISGLDANSNPVFTNTEIKFATHVRDFDGNIIAAIAMYNGKYYQGICDDFTLQNPKIIKIEKSTYGVYTDDYFRIQIEGTEVKISGLTQRGKEEVATDKKLLIPATIVCENGITYDVIEIKYAAFRDNLNIEQLEFESGSKLEKIGDYAFYGCTNLSGNIIIPNSVTTISQWTFEGCTSIESITIPSSVESLSWHVFEGWTETQTIYMQGRTEAPATVDDYQGQGWHHNWRNGCNATIVWEQ